MKFSEKLTLISELKRRADELRPPKDWDQAFRANRAYRHDASLEHIKIIESKILLKRNQ
jgi:hypothetical protein